MTMADMHGTARDMTLGQRLLRAREASGMSQSRLARSLGMRNSTVANWELDRSQPRSSKLQLLAGLLGVPIVWLMAGQGRGPESDAEASDVKVGDVLIELRAMRRAQQALLDRIGRLEDRLSTAPRD